MFIVIGENFLQKLYQDSLQNQQTVGPLYGISLDKGQVLQFFGTALGNERKLGYWLRGDQTALDQTATAPQEIVALLDGSLDNPTVSFFEKQAQGWQKQPHQQMSLYADFSSRRQGLFDNATLAKKQVCIVGLGTGGSIVAAQLAKAGVGKIKLVDFDRLEVGNVSRHLCGLKDVGRLKVDAVRDYLYNCSPIVEVETFNFDVTANPTLISQVLVGCDVLVGATDSEDAKGYLNRLAWKAQIPAVYGAAYDLGYGGDIFVADPPHGACYECFRNGTAEIFNSQPKSDIPDYGLIMPQPALELDVGMIAFLLARAALSVLLRNDATSNVRAFPTNWVIWGNQPWEGWLFDQPLQSKFIRVEPDNLCPVCHYDNYLHQKLGLNAEQANKAIGEMFRELNVKP